MTDNTLPLANVPVVTALTALYPDLSPPQILALAARVDHWAQQAVRETPWLCAALKNARTDAELRQEDVAGAMDWSLSKVVRIENGAVGISHGDLVALIRLYGIKDRQTVDRMVAEAKARRATDRRRGSAPAKVVKLEVVS